MVRCAVSLGTSQHTSPASVLFLSMGVGPEPLWALTLTNRYSQGE